ncbi:MAG: hypothetical protein KatS3mg042_0611 [Rhodothermaceae bacterium]|nr:MAG: hypothetical protein KatS3mg042_0611 [Rhodothermaceae bacterium]
MLVARAKGLCAGKTVYAGEGATYIVVWGDDIVTEETDGMLDGDPLLFGVLRASEGIVYQAEVTFEEGDGVYADGATHVVGTITLKSLRSRQSARTTVHLAGEVQNNEVVLTWTPGGPHAGFWVERSAGDDSVYVPVTFVPGQGSASQAPTYRHRVEGLPSGRHRFRLRQVDFDGQVSYTESVEVIVGMSGGYVLSAPYPNPFGSAARLELEVGRRQRVEAALYDVLGRRVAVLYAGEVPSGRRVVLSVPGTGLPSGLYVVRVRGEHFEAVRTLLRVETGF